KAIRGITPQPNDDLRGVGMLKVGGEGWDNGPPIASDSPQLNLMPQYFAFLRGINLGKRRPKMDDLRLLFEGLGFSGVESFIASGNVVFEAKSKHSSTLEQQIEQHLQQSLGYAVDTFIRTRAEIASIV